MNDTNSLQQLALRLSAFADVLNQHAAHLTHESGQSAKILQETVDLFSTQTQRLSQELVQAVGGQAREVIERGTADGMRRGGEQLNQATQNVQQAANALGQELQRLKSAQRSLVWKGGAALLVGSLLSAGGSSYLSWKNHRELKTAEFPTNVLDATRSGALTQCGGGLCARIGERSKRFGAKGEYIEIQ